MYLDIHSKPNISLNLGTHITEDISDQIVAFQTFIY